MKDHQGIIERLQALNEEKRAEIVRVLRDRAKHPAFFKPLDGGK